MWVRCRPDGPEVIYLGQAQIRSEHRIILNNLFEIQDYDVSAQVVLLKTSLFFQERTHKNFNLHGNP